MDFAFLPPEINSARMYGGPGSGSLLAAAGSWDALAAELGTTAETYGSVLSGLTSLQWRGPAAESMATTAAPYVGWLHTTAEQTKETAIQARAAASAFDQAYAMTVPPPMIAANRTLLKSLVASNFFGQNTAAIAATEAQYAEMWAQDAVAMYGYTTTSAAAAQLTPFCSPRRTTNPGGLTAQSAAVSQANAGAATDPFSQLISTVSQALQALPGLGTNPVIPENFTVLDSIFAVYASVSASQDIESMTAGIIGVEDTLGVLPTAVPAAESLPSGLAPVFASLNKIGGAVSASGLGGGAGLRDAVLASVGRAGSIGQLSVPAGWTAPSSGPVAALSGAGLTTLPGTETAAAAEAGMPGVPGMPVGAVGRASGVVPRYGVRLTVMAHPPAAG